MSTCLIVINIGYGPIHSYPPFATHTDFPSLKIMLKYHSETLY